MQVSLLLTHGIKVEVFKMLGCGLSLFLSKKPEGMSKIRGKFPRLQLPSKSENLTKVGLSPTLLLKL